MSEENDESESEITTDDSLLPDYVIELLDDIAQKEGFQNPSFAVRSSSNHGNCFSGEMRRVHVVLLGERNGSDDELSLICKLMPSNAEHHELLNLSKVFGREVIMYNKVIALMNEFQIEKGLSMKDRFFQYPRCYGIIEDEVDNKFAIVMEDLKKSEYQLLDKMKPAEFEHVKLAMESLGKFHAVSLAMKDQRRSVFENFKSLDDIVSTEVQQSEIMQSIFHCSYDNAIIAFEGDSDKENAINILKGLKKTFLHDLILLSDGSKSEPFSVINHGDCWINNFMFKYKEQAKIPEEICLLDWQLGRYSSPALDITYFMFSSTDGKFRERHYNELIKIYYKVLENTLLKLGSDPEKLFTFNDLLNELQRYGRFGLIYAPALLQIVTSRSSELPLPRIDEMTEDSSNNNLECKPTSKTSQENYNQRVRDVIKDGMLLGYF